MPYSMQNIPPWLKNLPKKAQEIGIAAFNAAFTKEEDEEKARQAA